MPPPSVHADSPTSRTHRVKRAPFDHIRLLVHEAPGKTSGKSRSGGDGWPRGMVPQGPGSGRHSSLGRGRTCMPSGTGKAVPLPPVGVGHRHAWFCCLSHVVSPVVGDVDHELRIRRDRAVCDLAARQSRLSGVSITGDFCRKKDASISMIGCRSRRESRAILSKA
jgi:hypothetical protein